MVSLRWHLKGLCIVHELVQISEQVLNRVAIVILGEIIVFMTFLVALVKSHRYSHIPEHRSV